MCEKNDNIPLSIAKDAAIRTDWVNKRVQLSELQKQYVEFQIKEAVVNALKNTPNILTKHCDMCEKDTEHRVIHSCLVCDGHL